MNGWTQQWFSGLLCLAGVVVLWVVSGFLVNAASQGFNKPWLITYFNTSLMAIYLIPPLLKRQLSLKQGSSSPDKLSNLETAKISAKFAVLWLLSCLMSNASYAYTTVESATILASTSAFFTYAFGVYMGLERATKQKALHLIVSFVGVTLVSLQDKDPNFSPRNEAAGNAMALAGACLYGLYTVYLRKSVQSESALDSKLFFGFIGFYNLIAGWPVLFILDRFGFEKFGLPPTRQIWVMLLLNGLTVVISDVLWVVAMLSTSPLVVTVGLSASIPLSMLGELILNQRVGSFTYIVGAAMVCWAFVAINQDELPEAEEQRLSNANHSQYHES